MNNIEEFFKIERLRQKLANSNNYSQLSKTYNESNPEIPNKNTKKLWNYLSIESELLKHKNPMYENRTKIITSLLKKDKNILNIGFGSAKLEEYAFNFVSSKTWYAIEISSKIVNFAHKKFPTAHFEVGDINQLTFKKNFFDYVLAIEVLEHIQPSRILNALKEIRRVLKPNAYFIVSVPLNEGLEKMLRTGENPNAHVRIYTPDLICAELTIAGFRIIDTKLLYAFHKNYKLKTFLANKILKSKYKHIANNVIVIASRI